MDKPDPIAAMIIIWLLLLSPLAPLGWLWLRTIASKGARLALAAMTVSYAWLLVALVTPSIEDYLLGPDYSYARTFVIPCSNIVVVLVAMSFLVSRRSQRIGGFSAGVLVTLCWAYALLISHAV